jgi:hypothetical protein
LTQTLTPTEHTELADVIFDTIAMDRAENDVHARPHSEIGLRF